MSNLLIRSFLPVVLSTILMAGDAEKQLDKLNQHFAAKDYAQALQALTPIVKELMTGSARFPSPDAVRESIKTDHAGVAALIEQVRGELLRKDVDAARKSCYALGLSLAALKGTQAAGDQVRSAQLNATAPAGSRLALVQSSNLLISTYKAGQFHDAKRLAEDILADAPKHPQTGRLVHNAHTVLGLVAWQNNDRESALRHLQLSVTALRPEASVKLGQPSFALAEALLAAGMRQPVLEYLDRAIGFAGWESAKEKLNGYRAGIADGSRTSFAPDHFLLF